MPLHRNKHYDQRRRLMKQPFETQQKAQRRLDYVFYAVIAVAVVVAMSFSLFKDHNIGRVVLFFLFLIWWTYFAFKSDLHRLAKKKGWETVAKMTHDPKAEKPHEEAALREEREMRICLLLIRTTVHFGASTPQMRYSVTHTMPTASKNTRPSIGILPNNWGCIISILKKAMLHLFHLDTGAKIKG